MSSRAGSVAEQVSLDLMSKEVEFSEASHSQRFALLLTYLHRRRMPRTDKTSCVSVSMTKALQFNCTEKCCQPFM